MKIEVTPFCDLSAMWSKVLRDSRRTVGKDDLLKEPSQNFKNSIMRSRHSPIRKLKFEIFIEEVPAFVSQQFSRHHIALASDPTSSFAEPIHPTDVEHFVQTSRADRTGIKRSERKQTDMVSYNFEANAQGLLDASKKRLCLASDPQAVKYWSEVKIQLAKICPEVAVKMQPECVCVGFCPEDPNLVKCRYTKTKQYEKLREEYIR